MPDDPPRRFDVLPLILLVGLVVLLAGGYLLFPKLQHLVFWQDCTAAGRTNC